MTREMLERNPDMDFLYYSNDMISAGGLLYLLEQGANIPDEIGLAGFNGVELLKGLPIELATMDACRKEIGYKAAEIIRWRLDGSFVQSDKIVELSPTLNEGETLR